MDAITWKGRNFETQSAWAWSGFGASNIDVAVPSSDFALTGGIAANGWALHSMIPLGVAYPAYPASVREGQIVRITNFTGYWGVVKHNGSGTAGYKIYTPNAEDLVLPAGGSVYSYIELQYWAQTGTAGWYVKNISDQDQQGVATLVAGVVTVTAAIKSTSRIFITQKTPAGTSLTTEYAALSTNRTNGVLGTFKITALLAAGTINTADTSTVDWLVKY